MLISWFKINYEGQINLFRAESSFFRVKINDFRAAFVPILRSYHLAVV